MDRRDGLNLRLSINVLGTVTTNPCVDGDLVSDFSSQKVVDWHIELPGCMNSFPLATVSQTCKKETCRSVIERGKRANAKENIVVWGAAKV